MIREHWLRVSSFSFSFSFAALLGFALVALRSADAAPILYGDFPGATVDYIGVQEESSTDPGRNVLGNGLFGAPTVAGDSMDFDPQAFAASSTGLGSDTTDSNLQFLVMAHTGHGINGIYFSEAGDTTLTGLAGDANTTVGAVINGEIVELNINGTLTPVSINLPQIAMGFTPKDNFLLSVDGAGTKGWTGDALLDLTGHAGAVTKVNISLDNTLGASSVAGTSAFIQKKDADGITITVETGGGIPEPASAAIAMIAVSLFGLGMRRK